MVAVSSFAHIMLSYWLRSLRMYNKMNPFFPRC